MSHQDEYTESPIRRNLDSPAVRILAVVGGVLLPLVLIGAVLTGVFLPSVVESQDRERAEECRRNLRQLGAALNVYAGDHDGSLPPATSGEEAGALFSRHFQEAMGGLIAFETTCPTSNQAYRFNLDLAGQDLSALPDPARVPAFCEPRPHVGGGFNTLFADGSVRELTVDELEELDADFR